MFPDESRQGTAFPPSWEFAGVPGGPVLAASAPKGGGHIAVAVGVPAAAHGSGRVRTGQRRRVAAELTAWVVAPATPAVAGTGRVPRELSAPRGRLLAGADAAGPRDAAPPS